eukprot:gene3582-3848_t
MGAEQSVPASTEPGEKQTSASPAAEAAAGPRALVVVGPSGVGKGTLIKRLMGGPQADKFAFSVSHTTRKPRPGEVAGVHYNFTDRLGFEEGIAAGDFLEHAEVHGNFYGTSKQAVQDTLAAGKVAVLDVDVQGARSIREAGLPALFVFVAPPSLEELERRLQGRGTETPVSMAKRIQNARQEISALNEHGLFDYLLLNDNLDESAAELERIAQRAIEGLPAEPGKVPDEAGLRVVAVARRRERLQELQQVVLSLGMAPSDFLPVVCDVTKEAEVAALPKIILKHWPDAGVDVLVNNAGLSRNDASLFDGNTSSWVEMVSTNILGNAMATRMAVQDMRRRGSWGHVINMVGLSGHRIPDAAAGGTFFAATKFAVRAITDGLRQEARAAKVPLRVSGISPGLVETEFFTVRAFGDPDAAKAVTSTMKCLQPSDVANAVLWCLAMPPHMEVNDIVIRPTQQMI